MKKSFKSIVAIAVVLMMIFSLSSCSIIQAMRDAKNNVEETVIYDDPAENDVISTFNEYLENSTVAANEINWSTSYNAGSIKITNADGEDAGVLDDAASQLKNFVMSSNPGAANGTLENNSTENTLLAAVDASKVLNFTYDRNYATENVTDENGDEVTDENGNTVTVEYISDNMLNLVLNYYEDLIIGTEVEETAAEASETEETAAEETTAEATTAEETTAEETTAEETEAEETTAEETTEAETTRIYSDEATIESIFGELKDKEAVIAQFDCIKDYLVLNDYTISYTDCSVSSEMDLENELLNYVTFTKNMVVTASVTGVGSLESYGELTVTLNLTQTTNYTFNYEVEETEENGDTTAAETTTEETTLEETSATEETTLEETSAE